ncbi:MAG: GGDEF domain-containing protein [Hyphomicrobiaceae bacterium]|nr:GGDEF domain-containing protein [Hyphomicrobiaceae bacterium]
MSQRDDFSRTYGYADTALTQIKRNELPAYPRNYEVWYAYSAGYNHALNKAINEVLRARGKVSPDDFQRIYNEFVAPTRISDKLEEVGDRIADEISQVVGMIEDSIDTTSSFAGTLDSANTKLGGATDREGITRIIEELILATKQAEQSNRTLESQLVESRRQIAELHENLEAIRYESLTDELTTLANRKHFDKSIERAIAQSEVTHEAFSLMMTDIDHFKKFNDTFGHQTGDQVLRLVALAVKQNVKGQDVACRYGGEEFAVILPKTNLRQAMAVAEHIREAVMAKELVKRSTGENLGRITISIGVSTWRPGDTPQSMIERADTCLYAAKRGGRNCVKTESDADVAAVASSMKVA